MNKKKTDIVYDMHKRMMREAKSLKTKEARNIYWAIILTMLLFGRCGGKNETREGFVEKAAPESVARLFKVDRNGRWYHAGRDGMDRFVKSIKKKYGDGYEQHMKEMDVYAKALFKAMREAREKKQ